MRRLCANGDGRLVQGRGLCDVCYHRAYVRGELPPWPTRLDGWPGFAVSRYTRNGIPCNDLPAVWAAERRQSA